MLKQSSPPAVSLPLDASSGIGNGEHDLSRLLTALAYAHLLGLHTVVIHLGGQPVTIDLEVLTEYLDGAIDRAEVLQRIVP